MLSKPSVVTGTDGAASSSAPPPVTRQSLPSTPALALEVRGLSKRFGATQALKRVSLDLRAGEVHVLLGENGAGKSTIAKLVGGIYTADEGEILVGGNSARIRSVRDACRHGIAVVFQELSLAPHLSVGENLFLGNEDRSHHFSLLRRRHEQTRAEEVLRELQIDASLQDPVENYSVGRKQLLEIGKALLRSPKVLIMDEPTSSLTEREKQFLFKVIRSVQAKGTAILYVTHHLREVFDIGSRVSTMRDGRVIETVDVTDQLTEGHLLQTLTGKRAGAALSHERKVAGEILLKVTGLHTVDGCRGIDLAVRHGEIVGLYGVVGSGREGVGRAVTGMTAAHQGQMLLAGRPYQPRSPAHAARFGVRYLAMDRKAQGILASRPIRENLTLSNLASYTRFGFLTYPREAADAKRRLDLLRVRYQTMENSILSLSGGNQQKVLFGRACSTTPQLIVMEDPTAGVDMGAKADLHEQIRQLVADGSSVLLLSSDLLETLTLCDRVYTTYQGQVNDEFVQPSLDDEGRVLARVLGRATEMGAAPASRRSQRTGIASPGAEHVPR
jgi:ribose transport system ATP-binding protein